MKPRHLFTALGIWLVFILSSPAQTYYVNASSTSPTFPYSSWATAATNIQDALLAGGSIGGTILVTNGVYQYGGGSDLGSNRVDVFYPNFTVQSVNGPAVTIIKGWQVPGTTNGTGAGAVRGVYLASGSVLSGFTVTGSATVDGNALAGGIYCQSTTAIVSNCVIIGNVASGNAGGVNSGTFNNCIIASNISDSFGGGAYLSTLNHCVVSNNLALTGAGVMNCAVYDSLLVNNGSTNSPLIFLTSAGAAYSSVLNNCTLMGNMSHSFGAAQACNLNNCIIYFNNTGTYADCYQCQLTNCCTTIGTGTSSLSNNSFSNIPAFVNPVAGDYHLQIGSPCVDAGLNSAETNSTDLDGNPRFAGGAVDIGAYESSYSNTVLYVSLTSTNPLPPYTNWLTAATNIQAAISVAQPGNVVAVGQGVYTNDATVIFGTETNRVAVTNGITLLGVAGPAFTIIMGTTQTRCAFVDSNSIISGFTITNGHGSVTGDLTNEQSGGGIWCQPGGQVLNCLVISNVLVTPFQTNRLGGGIYGGTISNCTLANNSAGAGGGAADATLMNCFLANNIAGIGGGAYRSILYSCTASNNVGIESFPLGAGCGVYQCIASNCLLTANTNASGSYVGGGGSFQGTNFNCTIAGNFAFASAGGGTFQSTNYNCTITGNFASQGAGANGGGLFNCVVNGNSSQGEGGGAYQAFLVNCTVVGNAANVDGGIDYCTAYNSIIYFNTASINPNTGGGNLYSCCTFPLPMAGGANNITNNPVFVDATNGDFQLACGSPCIDGGLTNAFTYATTNDIRGQPRPIDGTGLDTPKYDIGAFEFNPATDESPGIRPTLGFSTFATSFSAGFVAQISGCADYFWWDFGDDTIVSNLPTINHAWTLPGTYAVTLNAHYPDSGRTVSTSNLVQVLSQPVYYVNASILFPQPPYMNWLHASTTIQQAIGAGSLPGRLVLVTNGTYSSGTLVSLDGIVSNRVAITNPIVVQSVNGPLVTTIFQSSTVGTRCCYVGSNAFLSGFTITGGNTSTSGDTNRDGSGGGVWCETSGVVSNCVIKSNSSRYNGAGGFQGTYYNCVFTNNLAALSAPAQGSGVAYATLYNCLIISNTSSISVAGAGAGHCTLYNCTLVRNGINSTMGGGAAYSVLYDCIISNNLAAQGGGGYSNTFWNCLLAANRAPVGSGAYGCVLYNSTVAGNSSTGNGGGIVGGAATNSIIYGNTGANSNWINSVFGYSCTAPLPPGPGNTASDPAFVNPAAGDFHLLAPSSAINTGNNTFFYGVTDLDGHPRIMGGTIDMGAYEFQSPITGTFAAWLASFGLPTDGSANNADSDGTGMLNWQKWIAGLNPTNPASVLALTPLASTNIASGVTLTWFSVGTRNYFIQRALDLSSGFSTIQNNIPGQDGTTTFIDSTATGPGPYFYRVGVQ